MWLLPLFTTPDADLEPTLGLRIETLRTLVARELGYNPDYEELTAQEQTDVNTAINHGLRMFYFCGPIADSYGRKEKKVHEWSFLYPAAELITAADDSAYDLPADFGGFHSALIYDSTEIRGELQKITVEQIVKWIAESGESTGYPRYYAIRPGTDGGLYGQRWEILFWPVPGAAYTLTYHYKILPNSLTTMRPIPLGGEEHAETLIEACLAACRRQGDDGLSYHEQLFREALVGSVMRDRQNSTPSLLGLDAEEHIEEVAIPFGITYVTVNGVVPD